MPFANLGYYRTRYAHYKNSEDRDRMIAALRKAGVPENAYNYKENAENRLTAVELEMLVLNNAWKGTDEKGIEFVQQFTDDGRVAFSNQYMMLAGTTRLDGDSLCIKYTSGVLGREDCGFIYRNPEGTAEEENEFVRLAVGSVYYFTVP